MKNVIISDYYRTTSKREVNVIYYIKDFMFYHRVRYMFYFRLAQYTKKKTINLLCEYKLYRYSRKYGIEIKTHTSIGEGFVLLHPYNITVSPYAKIGKNVTMMKGSTVGLGKRIDGRIAPIIGDRVYIGINSTVLGGIKIGNDVIIAPNTLVTCDVPDHSVVIGCPCEIHHKGNATESLIWKRYCKDALD